MQKVFTQQATLSEKIAAADAKVNELTELSSKLEHDRADVNSRLSAVFETKRHVDEFQKQLEEQMRSLEKREAAVRASEMVQTRFPALFAQFLFTLVVYFVFVFPDTAKFKGRTGISIILHCTRIEGVTNQGSQ